MTTTASDLGGTEGNASLRDPRGESVRRSLVERIGTQVATGTYDPPLESVVDSLVVALLPAIRVRR